MCIDLSLSKGLRSGILKRMTECNFNDADGIARVLNKKSSPPSTTKGARKLFRDISKILDRHALMTWPDLFYKSEAWWVLWNIERAEHAQSDWTEDRLSACILGIYLKEPCIGTTVHDGNVSFGMHLIERVFQRLDTTDHATVIEELRYPAQMAVAMADTLKIKLAGKGIDNYPIMLPTKNGTIFGDFDVLKGEFRCRTFIGGASITGAKKKVDEQLGKWGMDFLKAYYRGMSCVILLEAEELAEWPDKISGIFLKLVDRYIAIMEEYNRVTPSIDQRVNRQRQETSVWQAARRQQASMSAHA